MQGARAIRVVADDVVVRVDPVATVNPAAFGASIFSIEAVLALNESVDVHVRQSP